MAEAFDGLRVIDFGYVAGPMAGMLLADQGANVVRRSAGRAPLGH